MFKAFSSGHKSFFLPEGSTIFAEDGNGISSGGGLLLLQIQIHTQIQKEPKMQINQTLGEMALCGCLQNSPHLPVF